jgi:TonB family protein
MKTLLLILLFAGYVCTASAQVFVSPNKPEYKLISKDTINVRGLVFDYAGKPVRGVQIRSTNKEIYYLGYATYATTDTAGRFLLTGALPHDALSIYGITDTVILNNGSRYIQITLPKPPRSQGPDTVSVTAKRQSKRPIVMFKVLTNEKLFDYYGFGYDWQAKYRGKKGDYQRFIDSQLVYPQKAIENNIEGEVEIGFYVERDGAVFNPYIIKGIGYGCDDAVMNAVKKGPHWLPAVQGGHPIIGKGSVVVDFKLTDK